MLAADYGIAANTIMLSSGAIMVASENTRGRWSRKTGIYVRKDVLNYNAIMAIENIHKVLMFHCQN